MQNLKEALEYLVELGESGSKPEVLEICGKTYCTKGLNRYDKPVYADPVKAATLSAMVDYIANKYSEFKEDMMIHILDETTVKLISGLDDERNRECLFVSQAHVSQFRFDEWYDQERLLIELQANFQMTDDLAAVLKVAGNVEAKTTANYGDDGMTQKTTIKNGITSKVDVIVPNPCILVPYRTFIEIKQPSSQFVFRIREGRGGDPEFKLIEAEGGLWKNEAISEIRDYFKAKLQNVDPEVQKRITIIA